MRTFFSFCVGIQPPNGIYSVDKKQNVNSFIFTVDLKRTNTAQNPESLIFRIFTKVAIT